MTGLARDVVFTFSTETWADAAARQFCRPTDRLALAVLRSDDVGQALLAEPWRSAPVSISARLAGRRAAHAPPQDGVLLSPRRLRRRDPVAVPALERSYGTYDRVLHRAARRLGMQDPVVLTCSPLVAGFAPLAWASTVTYFARDDWAAYPPHEQWWPAYREAHTRMRERRTRVAAVSEVLLERLAPTGPSIVAPNALDAPAWADPGPAPETVRPLPRPWYVYAGTLDGRLDVEAVAGLAQGLHEGTVLLVGPQPDPDALAALRGRPQIAIVPRLDQPELVGLLCAAEVALIPHRRTLLTEAMAPLKLGEYLAAGLPVAAADVVPPCDAEQRVVRYADGPGLPAAARAALQLGRWDDAARRAYVRGHSWEARDALVLGLALAGDDEQPAR